jgi:hypothetical protein
MKYALRFFWPYLSELRTKREQRHLALLRKVVGKEGQRPWGVGAGPDADAALWRYTSNRPARARLILVSLTQLAAEQLLRDIGVFETENGARC